MTVQHGSAVETFCTESALKVTLHRECTESAPMLLSALHSVVLYTREESTFYFAIVAPGILPSAPVRSTPVRAWMAGGRVPSNLFTS